ncbi:MAG: transporter substrate-binding domain-containing protein [Cyclobacteriaceae bacterium]|nr:transporter substrate-binding domain-containing protein [Cyclobacteriaceae bacterium]
MHFSKKWLLVFFTITGILSFTSCKQTVKESRDGNKNTIEEEIVNFDLDKIKERGSLRALVDNSSTSYFIYKGQLMGYEYELLTLLAHELGVDLEIIVTKSIDDAFRSLNKGEGDIIAFTLTVTKERQSRVAFTHAHYTTRQVLVQKNPDNWRSMKKHEIEKALIRNQVDLIGKEVHVRKSSSYVDRLKNLSEEIGGDIIVIEDEKDVETELMIRKVYNEEIAYTIADEDIALVNTSYYPDIDISTPISFPQQIAWAVRKNATELLNTINHWQAELKKEPTYNVIYNKYYNSPRASKARLTSDFSSISGEKISVYDGIIKQAADSLGWDWRLLAAQIYQESVFNPSDTSWAGAIGLMQIMPETGKRYQTYNLTNPKQNVMAGMRHLKHLNSLWAKTIEDEQERLKFILASYNVGLGHVIDARELAKKYNKNPTSWEGNVALYLQNKSKPKYFNDSVAKSGYCRCEEPVNYVKNVLSRYEQYKQLMD